MVPLWDFNATTPAQYGLDSSSALIAASGLVELSTYVSSAPKRATYRDAAQRIVDSVSAHFVFDPSVSDAVVMNGTSSFPKTNIPLIYGAVLLAPLRLPHVVPRMAHVLPHAWQATTF